MVNLMNQIKNFAWMLFIWYFFLRWIILNNSNSTSQDWGSNPFGNILALSTIVYLFYFIVTTNPTKSVIFRISTIALWLSNLAALLMMTKIFKSDPTPLNFGYEMLDIFILLFYSVLLLLCFMGIYNNIKCKIVAINV